MGADEKNTSTGQPEDMPDEKDMKTSTADASEETVETVEETAEETTAEDKTEETQDGATEDASKEEKSGFFKKKDKEKEQLKERITECEDKMKRQMAEFDNFRKRTEKEKEQMFAMGEKSAVEKLLPVVDNFERGLAAIPEDEKGTAFADGMDKIYKQMLVQLEAIGVTPIEAIGEEFDPNFHNAVMQVDSEDYDAGVVAQELQKGYMYHDTVLRHSMVGVVK